ncbi:MAG: hypothetical protein IPP78_08250 [Holophagaceae bacterium]|nr:hypothetical protein [Holophagaceae bacterium]
MRVLRSIFSAVFLMASVLILATTVSCGGGGGGGNNTPPPPTTGSMNLTVIGLPGSVAASISISGPGNFNQSATGSMTIPNLSPGSYTVNASSVASGGSTYLGSPATQAATVIAGQTVIATVTYAAQPISVSVSPTNPRVGANGSVQLSAVVSGSSNQNVTWTVEEGASGGSITPQGLYTAPATTGTYHVRATSVAGDGTNFSRSTITVSALGGFHIYPNGLETAPGGTYTFQALDDNTVVTTVTWSVDAAAGTVTPSGLFTASSSLGAYTLRVTNTATQQQATVPIHILSNVTLNLYGFTDSGTLFSCDGAFFGWELHPDTGIDRTVAWDVVEGAPGGSLLNMDWYRIYLGAPAPGIYHVRAVPTADPSKIRQRTVTVSANPSVGAFQSTSNAPATTRIGHGAAALPDGRVVITGGCGGNPGGYLSSIEVYNPGSNTFATFGASLLQARSAPVLVALDANRILVCGGEVAYDSASNGGEIIQIGAGTVTTATGTMRVRRMGHQVTGLTTGPNAGKFLITGGMDEPNFYGTVSGTTDLFDPASNTFAPLPQNMELARVNHSATRLNDGRVLIVGGNDGHSELSSAEIYDPIAGTFTYTAGHLATARAYHTATLLNDGTVLIVGGNTVSGHPESCEVFNPATGNFTAGPDMAEGRLFHTATRLNDGRVLVIGGNSGSYRYHGTAEVFTPGPNSWAYSGRMSKPRERHTAVLLPSGKVLVTGDLDPKSAPAGETSN